MPRISVTKKFIDQLDIPENIQVFHDTKVTGLQLRVSPKGSKTFYLYFRTKSGKQKRPKLGVYGILTVEEQRHGKSDAGELSKGNDPTDTDQVENITLADFFKILRKTISTSMSNQALQRHTALCLGLLSSQCSEKSYRRNHQIAR